MANKLLLSGNEAIAMAAYDAGVHLGVGYPGTPSSEILDYFNELGGKAEWAPNEKVALEVGIGAAFAHARALVTMKHVGLNVAADPLFTIAYCGTPGGLVVVSADDPGMASSQNEQDNRRYAAAAGVMMLEPTDSQEAYLYTLRAFEMSEQYHLPVLLRVTTRICHSKCIVERHHATEAPRPTHYERDVKQNVMIPAFARAAHRKLRAKLNELALFNESSDFVEETMNNASLGIIASGIAYQHALDLSVAIEPDEAVRRQSQTLRRLGRRRSDSVRRLPCGRYPGGRQSGNVPFRRIECLADPSDPGRRYFAGTAAAGRKTAAIVRRLPAPPDL